MRAHLRTILGLILGSTLLMGGVLVAAEPPGGGEKAAARARTYSFEMRDKPWGSVLEWLSDQTGVPVITSTKPTGTFTFISPKKKQYTVPEIIDILNEALLGQKFVLIRREQSFTIVPADEKIDPAILPRLRVTDLDDHGRTEIAQVVIPLTSLVAEDLAPEVKKMLGPFGEVVAMAKANQLVITDTVGNLKRVYQTIKEIEDSEKGQAESFSYVCKFIKARDAEKILKELLGDPREVIRLSQPQQPFGFPMGGPFGGRGGAMAQAQQQQAAPIAAKIRMHYISADERTNTVLVTGPADKIAQAREILKRIDVAQQGQQPVVVGPPVLKTYPVAAGNADALAKTLQEIYKASQTIRITSAGNNTILVWAPPEDQIEIAKQIITATEKNAKTEVIALGAQDASKVVDSLKGMLGEMKNGGPYVEADTTRNAVVVRGSPEQIAYIKSILAVMGESNGAGGNVRVITINKGSAAGVAEALQRMMQQMRGNPVRVIVPGAEQPAEKTNARPDNPGGGEEQEPRDPMPQGTPDKTEPPRRDTPAGQGAPVTITVLGNRIVVSSEDPQALALAQDLIRLLTEPPKGEGDFEIIRLKNASATEAAKVLDEAFNGPKQQPGQQFPFFNRFGAPGVQPPANPSENKVRVVADPGSNSLLVRASPVDMMTIRRLLEKAIDTSETDSKAVMRTWVIGPLKYASAAEVAMVIRDVYREHMNNNPTTMQVGGFRGFGFFGRGGPGGLAQQNQNVDANGNPRAVTLSVGVDDRTNSLVVNCSSALHEDIKKLADRLDQDAKNSSRTVRVIQVKGVDPALVQQAVDAIQGRATATRSTTGTSGTSGFQPRGNGNFMPGGNGFMPGGSPGGFRPGGGSNPGQGGGNPGGGRPPGLSQTPPPQRGPDFFAGRVTDDPRPSILYDPSVHQAGDDAAPTDAAPQASSTAVRESSGIRRVAIRLDADGDQSPGRPDPAEPEEQQAPPPVGGDIRGPRAPVTAEALPELGVVVVTGNNPADVEEIVRVIEAIQRVAAGAQFKVRLVPLAQADATAVAATLSQLYARVIVGASSTTAGRQPTTTTTFQGFAGQATATSQQPSSVVLLPLPRLNAILVAAPETRMADVVGEIKRLDVANAAQTTPVSFPLKKASAARVAGLLSSFYAARYPTEGSGQDQVRITHDDSTNTVFVQAAPADLKEIRDLIWRLDNTESPAVNDIRIVPLRNVLSDEMAALLQQAISQGIVAPTAPATQVVPTPTGLPGARPGTTTGPGVAPTAPAPTTPGGATKTTSLRFINPRRDGPPVIESGLLEDIHITSDPRINSIIISAPPKSMQLILALIRELDVLPALRAEINIFTLKKADATAMALLLQQLFLGTGGLPPGTPGAPPTPVPGAATTILPGAAPGLTPGGLPGGFPGGALPGGARPGGAPGSAGGPAGGAPLAITPTTTTPVTLASGMTPEGTPLVELRITVDQRTNSVIVAGSRAELDIIEAVISRLEDADVQIRRNEVYHLKNSTAADVANAINNFLTSSLRVLQLGQQLTAFQEIEREVVVVPEPISNKLLISATPRYYSDIIKIIEELDAEPPQVVIQALVAEVDLTNTEEFGVEIGLQSPVLFQRSVIPQLGFLGPNGTVTFQNPSVPAGVTVNATVNPTAQPGFNFNNVTLPLGNNPVAGPGIVGFQGLGNLGVGRSSPTSGVGGFVFSAASDTFNLLVRALKTQGRLDILSRPQVMTLDNQSARILVGQSIPFITATNITATGLITNSVNYRDVGVQLQVTPKISPDGKVIMRVIPEISSVANTQINLGNGVTATAFNEQTVETTVTAMDGETVAIGGLISKRDDKTENKIPWFGDLPVVGALFRYRTESKTKTELLVILTPHIVRSKYEANVVLAAESRRMDWILGDVLKIHGTSGMGPVLPTPPGAPGDAPMCAPGMVPGPAGGMVPAPMAAPAIVSPPATVAPDTLPAPRRITGTPVPQVVPVPPPPPTNGPSAPPVTRLPDVAPSPVVPTGYAPPPAGTGAAVAPGMETTPCVPARKP